MVHKKTVDRLHVPQIRKTSQSLRVDLQRNTVPRASVLHPLQPQQENYDRQLRPHDGHHPIRKDLNAQPHALPTPFSDTLRNVHLQDVRERHQVATRRTPLHILVLRECRADRHFGRI